MSVPAGGISGIAAVAGILPGEGLRFCARTATRGAVRLWRRLDRHLVDGDAVRAQRLDDRVALVRELAVRFDRVDLDFYRELSVGHAQFGRHLSEFVRPQLDLQRLDGSAGRDIDMPRSDDLLERC